MDYEKKYKEALEKARMYRDNAIEVEEYSAVARYENIFPELAESEDERIRRSIIKLLQRGGYMSPADKNKAFAWLEKQKEQKSEIPLMNGDADLYFDEWNQQQQNPTKRQCFEEGMRYAERLQKEQKPAEWSEEDEKASHFIAEYLERLDRPTSKSCLAWLNNRLRLLRPQPKQKDRFWEGYIKGLSEARKPPFNIEDWLTEKEEADEQDKQPHWKPSEEQMGEALVARDIDGSLILHIDPDHKMELPSEMFPELTWGGEKCLIKVELIIRPL